MSYGEVQSQEFKQGIEKYCVQVANRFTDLEDLDAEVEINSAWKMITENMKISAKESLGYLEWKKHDPWFDKGCSRYWIKGNKLNCSGCRIQVN
jgi:hypothetical protein